MPGGWTIRRAATRLRRLATRWKKRSDVTIRQASLAGIREEARKIREIYNQAWRHNWGFVPFTESEFEFMTRELKPILLPEFVWLAEIGNSPVGFILCVPDINEALAKINGRLTTFGLPIGLAKLLYHKSRIKRVRLVALGVVPKYRRNGIAEMLVLRTIEEAMIKRGLVGEASLILEDNQLMNRFLAAIGPEKYKTYRIYRRRLEGEDGVMAEVKSFRRVLVVADQAADWMVAGLRQLDRLALSIDEFAVENKETAPVLVCILWRPDLDQSQRWVPTHHRMTKVAFTNELGGEPFDLVLNTRLFLYRNAVRRLMEAPISVSPEISPSSEA